MTPGITPRTRRDATVVFEAQVRRPKVNRKAVSPISKTFGTQAEAVAWREETLARVRQERADAKAEAQAEPAVRHTVASWAAVWLARLERSRYLAPSTRCSYAAQLTNHVLPVLGAVALRWMSCALGS